MSVIEIREEFWCWELTKLTPCPLQGKMSCCVLSLYCHSFNFHADHDKA